MPFKKLLDATNDPRGVDAACYKANGAILPLRLEFLHNLKKLIIDLGLTSKLQLDLIKIRQCILDLNVLYFRSVAPHAP